MIKTLVPLLLLLIEINQCFAQGRISRDSMTALLKKAPAFTIYNDNYFLTGANLNQRINSDNADAKFQISFKQRLTSLMLPLKTYLFLTYTQKSFWDIYKFSSPFSETNYNAGIGIARPIFKNDVLIGALALKVDHESNGRDSIESRSWNFISLNYQSGITAKTSFMIQIWCPYRVANKNLISYIGYGEARLRYIVRADKLIVDLIGRKGAVGWNGNLSTSLSFRPFKFSNQYLTVQWWQGHAENLIRYQEYTSKVRLGLTIKPIHSIFY